MADLKSLRSKLMNIQQKSSSNKLSERNVVEVLQKLVQTYKLEIVYCLSGKDYLTPSRLVQEIIKEVEQEGRVSLLDLPNLVGVSIENIENRIGLVVSSKVKLVNGQLMSGYYIDSLCSEINLALQESGQVLLSDLTVKYSLPMPFLKEEIEKKIGKTIQGKFSGPSTIVTDTYVVRHLGRLRGTLRASRKPVDLKAFDSNLVVKQVKELISTGQVLGSLEGQVFTPGMYKQSLWDEVTSQYFINRYLEFDYLKKKTQILGVSDFKEICSKLENGEYLHSAFVHNDLISETKSTILEKMKGKSLIDFYELELPGCFDEEDIEGLVGKEIGSFSHYLYTERAVEAAVSLLNNLISAFVEESKEAKGKKKETISLDTIKKELKKKKFLNASEEFLEGFCEVVYSKIISVVSERREARAPSEQLQDTLANDFSIIFLCNKSIVNLSKVFQNTKPLQIHVVKTIANNFFNQLVKVQLIHHGHQVPSISTNDRARFIQKLPDYLKEILGKISEKLTAKDLDGFVSEVLSNIKDIPVISIRPVDKKTERTILHKLRADLKSRFLEAVNDKKWNEAAVTGARVKLIDSSYLIEAPGEKWAVQLIGQFYNSVIKNDPINDLLQIVSQSLDTREITESSQRAVSFIIS